MKYVEVFFSEQPHTVRITRDGGKTFTTRQGDVERANRQQFRTHKRSDMRDSQVKVEKNLAKHSQPATNGNGLFWYEAKPYRHLTTEQRRTKEKASQRTFKQVFG